MRPTQQTLQTNPPCRSAAAEPIALSSKCAALQCGIANNSHSYLSIVPSRMPVQAAQTPREGGTSYRKDLRLLSVCQNKILSDDVP